MSVAITDPVLLAQLTAAGGEVPITDAQGNHIGRFIFEPSCKPPAGFKLPFTDEQIAEFRKERDGRPLADILRDLKARE